MIQKIRNPKEILSRLKAKGEAFQLISTTLTKKIITATRTYYFTQKTGLKMAELGLIKAVKDYVIDNNIKCKSYKGKISYVNRAILKNGTYKKQLYEVDLNSAFWNFAYKNKHISKEIYEKGNNKKIISKKARLIALGNLAKVQKVFDYNGSEFDGFNQIESSDTESVFFKVAHQTDNVMSKLKILANKKYLFYWVDAIFIQGNDTLKLIEQYLKDNKLTYKVIPLNEVLKTQNYIKVWDDKHLYSNTDYVKGKCTKVQIGEPKPRLFNFEPLKIKDLTKIINQ
jgi:hypothetical protein